MFINNYVDTKNILIKKKSNCFLSGIDFILTLHQLGAYNTGILPNAKYNSNPNANSVRNPNPDPTLNPNLKPNSNHNPKV